MRIRVMPDGSLGAWSDQQHALVIGLLNEIIPASTDGRFPSAGSPAVCTYVAKRTEDVEGFAALIERGLRLAGSLADSHRAPFAKWQPDERLAWAREVESRETEFFAILVRFTYMGYYTQPSIPPLLGLSDTPPHPGGYEVSGESEADVRKSVGQVAGRGRCYLDVPG